ncbi:hypothetical protein [Bacillus salipaludis]|uniref:Uncharacterized protein n=1 Tax=Bacillus salipaludis TaxID=2547811 RepID=A0ABW8R9P9_9BACI
MNENLLTIIAGLESKSQPPLAGAIFKKAAYLKIDIRVEEFAGIRIAVSLLNR